MTAPTAHGAPGDRVDAPVVGIASGQGRQGRRERQERQEMSRGKVARLGTDHRTNPRIRVVDGALRCIARQGATRTTVDDLAREAGVSRATLYRTFPGGKDAVLAAVVQTEVARLFAGLAVEMGKADELEDVLVAGIVGAARGIRGHAALGQVLLDEPEIVLPHLAFAEMDHVLLVAGRLVAPFFARWLGPDQAERAAEWVVRIVVAYLACPSDDIDLANSDDVRRLVGTFIMPGIDLLRVTEGRPGLPTSALPDHGAGVRSEHDVDASIAQASFSVGTEDSRKLGPEPHSAANHANAQRPLLTEPLAEVRQLQGDHRRAKPRHSAIVKGGSRS